MVELDRFFERYDKENIGDDTQFTLKGTFADLLDKGLSWADLLSFVENGKHSVWAGSDCCIVHGSSDKPEGHDYVVEFLTQTSDDKAHKVQVTAPWADFTASTLHGLFQLVGSSKTEGDEVSEATKITCKCFATNPRTALATLQPQLLKDAISASSRNKAPISSLSFQFLLIDQETIKAIVASGASDIELRQCTVDGLDTALALNQGPEKLILSCAMPEFAKLGPGLAGNSSLKELELLLHFWLQGSALELFTTAIKANLGLKRLSISYLDINDQGWDELCQSLHQHPALERLELVFTEKFVDNFRRLTPERRTSRSKAVLELLHANSRILEIVWPEFQQDEALMQEVTVLLDERKRERICK